MAKATSIKNKVKKTIRHIEDNMDYQYDRNGEVTLGMSERGVYASAEQVLEGVRAIQQDHSIETPDKVKELCNNKFNLEATLN